ncbi:MAG TPA: protoporphyrinogen oxidase HemJ [Stellaceae bacterium]|nr:protoporphyrinogen oxidase HemJ [Stellaceae bacterium]
MSFLSAIYFWVKALHIISIVAWMAGLLYLPRLFVYHAGVAANSETAQTFRVMERRLLRAIMTPAMIASYVFGALLAATPGVVDWHERWFIAKLFLVAALTVIHFLLASWRRDFAAGRNRRSPRFYRIVNEVPTLLMVFIIILVVVRPF